MDKKRFPVLALIALIGLLADCAARGPGAGRTELSPIQGKMTANEFPEIELVTVRGDSHQGKLILLTDEEVTLRPSPYWGVEPLAVAIADIRSIELPRPKKMAGGGLVEGFGWGFIVSGAIMGASSKYDRDFQQALAGSAVIGLAAGLVGVVVNGFSSLIAKTRFEFSSLDHHQKRERLKKIMGIPASWRGTQ